MAEQTYKMSSKLSIFIRNDGTVLQKFHIQFENWNVVSVVIMSCKSMANLNDFN